MKFFPHVSIQHYVLFLHLEQGILYWPHFQGSMMFVINVDTENGGMQMNNDFCVDFGDEPEGPSLAHEVTFL